MRNADMLLALGLVTWLAVSTVSRGTSLTIVVTNLPDEGNTAEGRPVACVGTFNGWDFNAAIATVNQHRLTYSLPSVALTTLGTDWDDRPAGANAGFQLVKAGSWDLAVRADFQSNDGNFRVTLVEGAANTIEIDAGVVPTLVDQSASLRLNGVVASPVAPIDTRAFAFPGGRWKALVMSYDDGHVQDRDLAAIFNSHGIKGTFHINSGSLNQSTFLSSGELSSTFGGHEISSHSVNHPHLVQENDASVAYQVAQDRSALAGFSGYAMRSMAYPFGDTDERVMSILAQNAVPCARTVQAAGKLNYLPTHPLKWHPTCHHTAAAGYADQLVAWNQEEMALLFIWGHSWELDNNYADNSWPYMEALCTTLGDRGDIWYASMGDVHEYLAAIRALEHPSPTVVHNPSGSVTVWAKLGGVLSRIRPGKRVTFPSGAASVAPDRPEEGSILSIRYAPGSNALAQAGSIYVHIGHDGWQDTVDVPMTPGAGGEWTASYALAVGVRSVNFAFTDGAGVWDDRGGDDWLHAIHSASTGTPAALQLAPGSPVVSARPNSAQNRIGDAFDLNTAGGSLGTIDRGGFGSFGQVYFNYDAQNLTIGATGCNLAGSNNAMVIFLALDTLPGGVSNLWNFRGTPYGLDKMHNVAFANPVQVAIVLGDEYGDATFTHFNLGNGYDFGQGVFRLSTSENFFTPLAGANLSQFDGSGVGLATTADDDGDRLMDRWEVVIPWSSLNAPFGAASLGRLRVSGLIASDGVQGQDRYLSSNTLGEHASGTTNANGNFGFNFVALTAASVGLPGVDSDRDGSVDLDEQQAGTDPGDAGSVFTLSAADAQPSGPVFRFASVPGKQYRVQTKRDLCASTPWTDLPGTISATGSSCDVTLPIQGASNLAFRVRLSAP